MKTAGVLVRHLKVVSYKFILGEALGFMVIITMVPLRAARQLCLCYLRVH